MNDLKLYEKLPLEQYPIRLSIKAGSVKFPPHWHEYTEIHFARRGSFEMIWSNHTHTLNRYDCAIVNANELHEGSGTNCDDLVIMIHPSFFDNHYVIFEHLVNDDTVSDIILKIFDEYEKKHNMAQFAIKGYTYQLITYLCRNYALAELSAGNYRAFSQKYKTVNSVMEYINEHYYEDITTKFLAEYTHLSQSHFCHIFKDVAGKSAKEYLIQVRIERAADLLKNTDMNITEIAFSCGFLDANYFARVFKKLKNVKPTEYKNR